MDPGHHLPHESAHAPFCEFEKRLIKSGAVYVASGGTRKAYRRGRWIYKLPNSTWGVTCNEREAQKYKAFVRRAAADRAVSRYARCKLLSNGVLVMELLTMPDDEQELPEWACNFDSSQVGIDRRGRYAAWDYA